LRDKIPHDIKDTLDAVIYGKSFHPKWFMKDYSVYHSSFLSFVYFLLNFLRIYLHYEFFGYTILFDRYILFLCLHFEHSY
jgi:hypothetical protein